MQEFSAIVPQAGMRLRKVSFHVPTSLKGPILVAWGSLQVGDVVEIVTVGPSLIAYEIGDETHFLPRSALTSEFLTLA